MYGQRGIIKYWEYLVATNQHSFIDRESTEEEVEAFFEWVTTVEKSVPTWFYPTQERACALIRKCLPQAHLFPRNRDDFLDLKEDFWVEEHTHAYHYAPMNYKFLVRDAIALQTKFMYDNEVYYENGYLNMGNTFTIGQYTAGSQNPGVVDRLWTRMHPQVYNCFEQMGWTYAGLDRPLDMSIFYKGE